MFEKINLQLFAEDGENSNQNTATPEENKNPSDTPENKTQEKKKPLKAPKKTPEDYLEERVPVMLYKDADKYKDDVVLAINGEKIQIQRGVQVFIKRKFMMVLENQYRQQMIASNMMEELAGEYANSSKARGIQI